MQFCGMLLVGYLKCVLLILEVNLLCFSPPLVLQYLAQRTITVHMKNSAKWLFYFRRFLCSKSLTDTLVFACFLQAGAKEVKEA